MTGLPGPPPNPRRGRQRFLVIFLRAALAAVALAAAATLVLPDDVDHAVSWATVTLLVAAPVIRVGWLAVRWVRLGDGRYAAVAVGLLGVMGAGAGVAALT